MGARGSMRGRRGGAWAAARLVAAAAALAAGAGASIGAGGDGANDSPAAKRTGYVHVEGVIDRLKARYLARALDDARAAGLDTLVVHLDTDGGEVGYAREMFKDVLSAPGAGAARGADPAGKAGPPAAGGGGPDRAASGPGGANPSGGATADPEAASREREAANRGGGGPVRAAAGRGGAPRPRMIAFVDYRALSAGAMIAYAHHEIHLTEGASIGDVGVIFRKPDGTIEYAPEKIETVIRTLLAQAAEQRGWPRGPLLKMTARNQNLYRITPPAGGEPVYVIEDDLPAWLADHPEVDRDDPAQVFVYRGHDRLLTLTGREAVALGMATALVDDLPALYARLGVDPAEVVNLRPGPAERIAVWLAGITPLLMGLALLLLFFEINTPGVGLWAVLAAVFGGLFLFAHYYLDLVEHFEIALLLLGIGLVAAEVLLLPAGGVLVAAGGLCVLAGTVLAFLPNEIDFAPADPDFQEALLDAALSGGTALAVAAAGLLLLFKVVPRARLLRPKLTVEAEITGTSAGPADRSPIGRTGYAEGALRPAGTVVVGRVHHSARAEHGAWIAAGEPVEVVRAELGELVVRAARR